MFIVLKQRIDTVIVETDLSVHNKQDAVGMETDVFCELKSVNLR